MHVQYVLVKAKLMYFLLVNIFYTFKQQYNVWVVMLTVLGIIHSSITFLIFLSRSDSILSWWQRARSRDRPQLMHVRWCSSLCAHSVCCSFPIARVATFQQESHRRSLLITWKKINSVHIQSVLFDDFFKGFCSGHGTSGDGDRIIYLVFTDQVSSQWNMEVCNHHCAAPGFRGQTVSFI